mmetsp:Transcript_13955/g.17107  ORF Transcript_13955/g.17107 Transcript_13955/m.17107 type:complete len:82 (-) Transcript_13955:157-402(-)
MAVQSVGSNRNAIQGGNHPVRSRNHETTGSVMGPKKVLAGPRARLDGADPTDYTTVSGIDATKGGSCSHIPKTLAESAELE